MSWLSLRLIDHEADIIVIYVKFNVEYEYEIFIW
jgi:hypothetical protein